MSSSASAYRRGKSSLPLTLTATGREITLRKSQRQRRSAAREEEKQNFKKEEKRTQDGTIRERGDEKARKKGVRFEVFTAATMRNAVVLDIKTQFVLHRRHISPLHSQAR
jgi:Na+-translocating ferredoxin:NAD+ oxidoreductase RnfG subunit